MSTAFTDLQDMSMQPKLHAQQSPAGNCETLGSPQPTSKAEISHALHFSPDTKARVSLTAPKSHFLHTVTCSCRLHPDNIADFILRCLCRANTELQESTSYMLDLLGTPQQAPSKPLILLDMLCVLLHMLPCHAPTTPP